MVAAVVRVTASTTHSSVSVQASTNGITATNTNTFVSKVAGLFTIAAPGLNGSVSTVVKDTGIFGIAAAMADGNSCPSIGPITGVLPIATIAVAVGSYILGCSSVATYRASGRRYTGAYQESIEGSTELHSVGSRAGEEKVVFLEQVMFLSEGSERL